MATYEMTRGWRSAVARSRYLVQKLFQVKSRKNYSFWRISGIFVYPFILWEITSSKAFSYSFLYAWKPFTFGTTTEAVKVGLTSNSA